MVFHRALVCFPLFALVRILQGAETAPFADQTRSIPAISGSDEKEPIVLLARDAITHGTQMHYESSPVKNCLGYWLKTEDWAEWEFKVSQPGLFDIEVWQGCGQSEGGSEVAVEVGNERFTFAVEETGHFQIFLPRRIGHVTLREGAHRLALKPLRKHANAIMDIRQVKLLPVVSSLRAEPQFPGRR